MLKRNSSPVGGWVVLCDGCGHEILAQLFEDRLVVTDKRHGTRHIAVIPRSDILRIMGMGTHQDDKPEKCVHEPVAQRIDMSS